MAVDKQELRHKPQKFVMHGPRIWVPLEVLRGRAWAELSFSAKALLFDLASQLRARHGEIYNNGDLTTALEVLSPAGWTRRGTVLKAAKELENAGLICKTRQGRLPNLATLFGLTWLPLNESNKLDIRAQGFAFKAYLLKDPAPSLRQSVDDAKRPRLTAARTKNELEPPHFRRA